MGFYQRPSDNPPGSQQAHQPAATPAISDARGFFASLFDFSFSAFITPKLIKVLFILAVILVPLFLLLFTIGAFARNAAFGAFVLLIVDPLLFLLYIILARVYLELIVILFRIEEHTAILAGTGRRETGV